VRDRREQVTRNNGAISPARRLALDVLCRVEQSEAYADQLLSARLAGSPLSARDRRLATELVGGTLRRRGSVDYLLGLLLHRPLSRLSTPIRNVLRLGLYQLRYTRVAAHAAVHQSVELAKERGHRGTARLVNALLNSYLRQRETLSWPDPGRDPVAHLAAAESHPAWLVERWILRFGFAGAQELCRANNHPPAPVLRANLLKAERAALESRLREEGARIGAGNHAPESLHYLGGPPLSELTAFSQGWFAIQDESSQLASRAVAPAPGEIVVDLCAGRGGKALHLAGLMENQGLVVAVDIHSFKLEVLEREAHRLGITAVRTLRADSRRVTREDLGLEAEGGADAVLLDAPCSGLGVLRRRADARWRKGPSLLVHLPELQAELLLAAERLLRPGGVLVYCSCSSEPEENQEVLKKFMTIVHGMRVENLGDVMPPSLKEAVTESGWIQLLPHVHGTDGFFIARLRKGERVE